MIRREKEIDHILYPSKVFERNMTNMYYCDFSVRRDFNKVDR